MRTLIRARNARIGVEGMVIVPPEGSFDIVIDAPSAELRPGLINAHDHLHRNHYGRLGTPPYPSAYAWARDIQRRHAARIADGQAIDRRAALLHGAWKNLFAGVTSVVHHDRPEPDFDARFPIRVVAVQSADSLGMSGVGGIDPNQRFCLHLAEGVDARARGEVRALERRGLLGANLIAVHGVGIEGEAIARFRASGAALVWCPSSNFFLLGQSVSEALLAPGMDLLLGSDSLLTGAGDLLDELRCARAIGAVSDARLEDAVGAVAARRLGLPRPSLEPGATADLVLLSRPLLDASARDVLMVMVDGAPRVLRPDLVPALGDLLPPGRTLCIDAVERWTAEPQAAPEAPRSGRFVRNQ